MKVLKNIQIEEIKTNAITKEDIESYQKVVNRDYSNVKEGDIKNIEVLVSALSFEKTKPDEISLLTRKMCIATPNVNAYPTFFGNAFVDSIGRKIESYQFTKESIFKLKLATMEAICNVAYVPISKKSVTTDIGLKNIPEFYNALYLAQDMVSKIEAIKTQEIKQSVKLRNNNTDYIIYGQTYGTHPKNFFDCDYYKVGGEYEDDLFNICIKIAFEDRIKEENKFEEEAINAFYKEHIENKKLTDIDPDTLDFYSDWHKDVYGFRPHGDAKCGEYINPHILEIETEDSYDKEGGYER